MRYAVNDREFHDTLSTGPTPLEGERKPESAWHRPGRRGPLPGSTEQIARVFAGVAIVSLIVIAAVSAWRAFS